MKFTPILLSGIAICFSSLCFAQDTDKKPEPEYGKTVIAIAPISFSEISKGVGLSYERALDKDGIISLWIPVMFGFRTYSDNLTYTSNSAVYGNFYAMPGIKIYPTGSFAKCKYSIGPNLVLATGDRPTDYNILIGGGPTENFLKLGFMVNNSLNLNPMRHLYLGLDFGFGITYINQQGGVDKGTSGLVHFAFRIGYRN